MSVMEDTEMDRSSKRANLIEQRIFEINIASLDTLKHSTAIEIHKSQNEMKKRLHRYRNRQREIVKAKPGSNENSIEEMMTRQMKNKAKARQQTRPKTTMGFCRSPGSAGTETYSDSESDVEIDGSFMIDQQKSKIDLRPKTAMDILYGRRNVSLDTYVTSGRLGPAVKQTRYFDEDELKDRGQFYKFLVDKRITEEKGKLNSLDEKVAQFCGSETIQTIARKMQSKRKFFAKNPEWAENVRAKTSHGARKPAMRNTSVKRSERSTLIRPSTSLGTVRDNINIDLRSFKKPAFIATAR